MTPLATVAGMGLLAAWVLVVLAVLAALWCGVGAARSTRRERTRANR